MTHADRDGAIGIDIGGTKVAAGLVDSRGQIVRRERFPLRSFARPAAFVERLVELVRELSAGAAPRGIGIGAPGPLDLEHGILLNDATLPTLYAVDLVRQLTEATGLEVWLENDADAALLGETWCGAASGPGCRDDAAMLTFGTGIGGAMLSGGRILRGFGGLHPELGQLLLPGGDDAVEDRLAGPALNRLASTLPGCADAAELLRRVRGGDAAAQELFAPIRRTAGHLLWNVLHSFAPRCIVFGGGIMAEHWELFADELAAVAGRAYMVSGQHVRLAGAALGNDAGIVGAARSILEPACVGERPRDGSTRMTMVACADHETMSRQASEQVVRLVRDRPDALLCLATGNTPLRLYELLGAQAAAEPGLFSRLRILKLDEWCGVRPDLPATCESLLQEHVLRPWGIGADRYCGFALNPADPAGECARIHQWLSDHGPIDMAILGLGVSGHIGFNEPGDSLAAWSHVAQLAPASLAHAMVAGEEPRGIGGITLGVADLLRARRVLLMVGGGGKHDVFDRLSHGPVTPQLPASMLHLHADALCLWDESAIGPTTAGTTRSSFE